MAITPKNIERQIENGIIELLEADTFIVSNSIPVINWYDVDTEVVGHQVIVHCAPVLPAIVDENGEAGEWEARIDLLSYNHISESDIPSGSDNSTYEFLLGFCASVTKATIQGKLTGLTVNGKTNANSDENYDDRFYSKAGSIIIFIQ